MFIKDLQARQTNVDVEAEVLEIGDVREFSKYGRQGRVANAIVTDGSGKVKLSLWNEQIDKVRPGDKVVIKKGYVGEFQGELQLTTGKFGTLEVVKGGEDPVPSEEKAEEEPSAAPEPEEKQEPASGSEKAAPSDEPAPEETKKKEASDESLDVEEEDLS